MVARLVAALSCAVAAIEAARWRQDFRSRPGRAAKLLPLQRLGTLRCATSFHTCACVLSLHGAFARFPADHMFALPALGDVDVESSPHC